MDLKKIFNLFRIFLIKSLKGITRGQTQGRSSKFGVFSRHLTTSEGELGVFFLVYPHRNQAMAAKL